ncbi:MAG: CPBP family intramembrane glutamic endopeptidase [Pseudomonadota bacterium]
MSTIVPIAFDHVLFVILAAILPLFGWLGIRRLRKNIAAGMPYTTRIRDYRNNMLLLWSVSGAALYSWWTLGRDWSVLGIAVPGGSYGLLSLSLLLAALVVGYSYRTYRLVERSDAVAGSVIDATRNFSFALPHTRRDLRWFYGLSVTAGITEELLYRGFMLVYLAAYVPVPLAIVVSSLLFAGGHAYQGRRGMLQVFMLGIVFAAIYVLSGSLLLSMLAHVLVDVFSGRAIHYAYNTPRAKAAAVEAC